MIVNVEFFVGNPIENVITSLNYKVDKTIFLGYKDVIEQQRKYTEDFLKRVCDVSSVEFYSVDKTDLTGMIDIIETRTKEENAKGNQVFFDLTGGESLLLVAFGLLSQELAAPMHVFDVVKNEIHEYGFDDIPTLTQVAECRPLSLNLDQFISLYGGTINYRMQKDYKHTWDGDDIKDVENMWGLYQEYNDKWVHYCALLRKFEPDSQLYVTIDTKQLKDELMRSHKLSDISKFQQFLNDCKALGLLHSVQFEKRFCRYAYKSETIRQYFWDSGSILEMYTFLLESRKEEVDDCRIGVHIDWDGVLHNNAGEDVLNEIDIMSISNNLPTFISCKIGNADQMSLYELETVASRFGGKYAKKVLAVAKEMSSGHVRRATEMQIEVRKI